MSSTKEERVTPKLIAWLATHRCLPPLEREWVRRRGCVNPVMIALKMRELSFALNLWFWGSMVITVLVVLFCCVAQDYELLPISKAEAIVWSRLALFVSLFPWLATLGIALLRRLNWNERRIVREFCSDAEEFYEWAGKPTSAENFLSPANKSTHHSIADQILVDSADLVNKQQRELKGLNPAAFFKEDRDKFVAAAAELKRLQDDLQHKYDVLRDFDLVPSGGPDQFYKKARRAA